MQHFWATHFTAIFCLAVGIGVSLVAGVFFALLPGALGAGRSFQLRAFYLAAIRYLPVFVRMSRLARRCQADAAAEAADARCAKQSWTGIFATIMITISIEIAALASNLRALRFRAAFQALA